MSRAEQWDFIVPDDDGELLAELRRHGVRLVIDGMYQSSPSTPAPRSTKPPARRFAGVGA